MFSSNALVSGKRITVNSVSSKLITFDLALTEEMFPRVTVVVWEAVGRGQIASATLDVTVQLERKDMQVILHLHIPPTTSSNMGLGTISTIFSLIWAYVYKTL